jgi:hypothetical protein
MTVRLRTVGQFLISACMLAVPIDVALAQATMPENACFQIMATPAGAGPSSAILLDRCTGQTWILARIYQAVTKKGRANNVAYRWEPLSKEATERPPPTQTPKPAPTGATATGDKCFTFQGRRFCE